LSSDGFEKVAETSEVPPGTSKVLKALGAEIFIVNIEGMFHAFPNKCTHAGGPLGRGKLTGSVMQCPWHGSKFDMNTGAVVGPPAKIPMAPFDVKVEGTTIWVRKPQS
jgi:nitrite reductase/ring-hydroxylating ferredoxin subunit